MVMVLSIGRLLFPILLLIRRASSTSTASATPGRSTHRRSSFTMDPEVRHRDYANEDYRAFVFATHPAHGMLLLHCTRKRKKPPHFQAPGGHLDQEDFQDALSRHPDNSLEGPALLVAASQIAAARELFEETGIDVRSALERLQPVRLRENSDQSILCEFKKRLFFRMILEDSDFVAAGMEPMGATPPRLMLQLSEEHQGFMFVPDVSNAVQLLVEHSGGKVSKALQKAIELDEIESSETLVIESSENVAHGGTS